LFELHKLYAHQATEQINHLKPSCQTLWTFITWTFVRWRSWKWIQCHRTFKSRCRNGKQLSVLYMLIFNCKGLFQRQSSHNYSYCFAVTVLS